MYDLIVLGGGPGGYLAAERAGEAGLNTLLIEKNKLGGVCLNEGCIPSKTLLNSAKIYDHAAHGEKYGVTSTGAAIDQAAVVARKNKVVKNLVSGIRAQLKSKKVTIKEGLGVIAGRAADGTITVKVGEESFEGKRLLIATGSEAVVPPIPGVSEGLQEGSVVTNREILDLEKIPATMVVVGGGVIGLEMANYFSTVGSQVTVVEMLDHIAGAADRELADILQKSFEKKGIVFHLGCQVTEVSGGKVSFKTPDGKIEQADSEVTLMSVGRRAVTQGFGLENLPVLVERGRIVTDTQGRTNVSGVYAVGDVNGIWMLAHAAYREAEVAINTILGKKDVMRYQAMPSVIYTNPEMAFVGETEETCKDKGIKYKKVTLPMNYSGRYMAENEAGEGLIKLLIDPERQRLLGCHMIGSYASEIILSAGILVETEMKIDHMKELIFPHPTVGEIIREAIFHS
ncbi:MAG: dihydrolipoyl dehydrogenase [Clostridiaceae bacterium]|nr:dihydrolipoyl dehydrogenase [Clostridiaceae bacterium]